jgi:hypothetical protein
LDVALFAGLFAAELLAAAGLAEVLAAEERAAPLPAAELLAPAVFADDVFALAAFDALAAGFFVVLLSALELLVALAMLASFQAPRVLHRPLLAEAPSLRRPVPLHAIRSQ